MTKPEIELSNLYLNLSIETGTSYDGSFHIYSRNGQEISGKVLSTNDKVVLGKSEISGTECEIPFYFKGRMAIPGEEHFGDFLLITNGGELNLPYCITVVPKKLRVMEQALSSLMDFMKFAKENWAKAREAFFTREFHDVFFSGNEEFHDLYHGLLKGQSKDIMLDNFLIEATRKKPAMVTTDIKSLFIKRGQAKEICMTLQGWGHIEGRIYARYGNLELEKDGFDIHDFEESKLGFSVGLKEGQYEDTLVIETVYQRIEIKIKEEVKEGLHPPVISKRKKGVYPVLLKFYVKLRTGELTAKEYISKSLAVLPETGNFYELYRFQLAIIEHQVSEGGNEEALKSLAETLEGKRQVFLRDNEVRSYYYYLMSLYKRDKASLLEAAIQIRDFYEKHKAFHDYLLLTLVDESYALDYRGQCDTYFEYMKKGENSPLLYLGLLDALNRAPYHLEMLKGGRSKLLLWGISHEYLSLELTKQFAHMAQKEKYFSKSHLKVLKKLYEVRQDTEYLKAICSLCIKGNKTHISYHKYFADAFENNLKIVGLNEYYVRTLDFSEFPELPMPLLYYFHYSNSLDKKEKAYLYANILHNKEKYKEILPNYLIRMEQFVREQMIEGRMNRYLLHLYEHFLPEILKRSEMAKYLPNIIFKKKLICYTPSIEGVYVYLDEREEYYVPFVDGMCQIEQFSDDMELYFVDTKANRYHSRICYEIMPYLNEEEYRDICMQYNSKNNKVMKKWIAPFEKSVERKMDLHYEEKDMRALNECLNQINYEIITPSYRRTLMNYYMACNRMEDAYFGAELYGSDTMDASGLYLLTCVGLYLHKEEKDDLLLVMAHKSFVGGKYNKEILLYLRQYFEGRGFDLMALWQVLKKEGLNTIEFEERLLNQMLFTRERDESMLDVLLSYLEKRENDDMAISMLEIYSVYYFLGRKKMTDSYFAILDRQACRENGLSFMSKLSYLLRKSQVGYGVNEKEGIKKLVEAFCDRQIVFDFYDAFTAFCEISPMLKEMTCFYCYGQENMDVKLSLVIESKEGVIRTETLDMEEINTGFYYGKAFLLAEETIEERRLFHQGEEIPANVVLTKMETAVAGSRLHVLTLMEKNKPTAKKAMEQYNNLLTRMNEQLKVLT